LFATTLSFNAILMWHIWTLLKVDGLQWNARAWGRILHYQWVFPGAWRVCFPAWAAWLKPGFHPWQDDNREHVATWKAENGETERASAT
ncbi:MAG: metal-dependent hydrolase, partial [Novosphingobium sp.]